MVFGGKKLGLNFSGRLPIIIGSTDFDQLTLVIGVVGSKGCDPDRSPPSGAYRLRPNVFTPHPA
jgi:hypothetical protein